MMLQLATRRLSTTARRGMSTVAATTAASSSSDGLQSYVSESPVATISKLDNGVTVASIFSADSTGPSYTTTTLTNAGSRFDKVGGEAALLAASLGGTVSRESISLSGIAPLTSSIADLASIKSSLTTKVSNASYESQMMDHLHSTAYQTSSPGNSLGNALEGSVESIDAITAGDVSGVLGNVSGSNVIVVGTGCGNHEKLVEEAGLAYGGLKSVGGSVVVAGGEKSAFIGSDVRIRYDSHSTATVALAFEGASSTDPKGMPLALMATLLGSYTTSSGLGKNVASATCQEIAAHSLASSFSAFNLSYSDTGLFGIIATSPDNKLDDLLWYVMPNMVRLAHGVSDEEFARAKLALKTQVLSAYDGDVALGEQISQQLATVGRAIPLSEMIARVDALTMDDVKAAANEVINDQDHALAAIGGIHELPDYNWIRRHSYMLRY
jgi:processing peptidase subunit beta